MHIDYKLSNCPHCNSTDLKLFGNENECYGLVMIKSENKQNVADLNTFLPVVAIVCKNCGHTELIHINAKGIKQ